MLETIIKKQCSPGDYFILAINDRNKPKSWRDIPFKYKNEKTLKIQIKEFLKEYPAKKYDLYFCPVTYKNNKRRKAEANDIKYLWQDIDEKDDIESLNPKPTYMWESSPNKYQGLWEIDRYLKPEEAEVLNKALSEYIGADKCHDIGHVLRIPGTINHKYKDKPIVGAIQDSKKIYRYKTIKKQLEVNSKPDKAQKTDNKINMSASKIIKKYNIKGKVLDLLTADQAEEGRRSDTIWFLENKLFEKGLEIPEIICLIKNSVWNKYSGRPDENERLTKEAEKILTKDFESGGKLSRIRKEKKEFKIDTYQDVMSNMNSFPGWMVEGFWGRRSHGLVAGQPKVFKSTYTHDLAISVASGKPFLNKFKVMETGPVLLIQNENVDWMMKDRTEKMIVNKGLVGRARIKNTHIVNIQWPVDLPFYSVNQQGFQLNEEEHQKQIEDMIKEIKPILVIFDPLYLMFSGNLNAAEELNPVLNWLLYLKNEYKTSVLVVHHYNKSTEANRGGQKMLGSVVLHGWVESAWYIRRKQQSNTNPNAEINEQMQEPTSVILEREFRTAGSYPELELKLRMGDYQDPTYEVEAEIYMEEDDNKADDSLKTEMVKDYIIQVLKSSSYPLNKKELIKQLFEKYPDARISQRKVKDIIDDMASNDDMSYLPSKGYYLK
jgi:RecA-family ATPase